MNKHKKTVEALFALADIRINGDNPWDIQVKNEKFYKRVLTEHILGLGESYMEGWWECEQLEEFICRAIRADLISKVKPTFAMILDYFIAKYFNLQTKKRSKAVIKTHYGLDNELFLSFLDPYNQYAGGYFKDTDDLDTAQLQRLELICKKLNLSSKDRVLDIGCGWGGFAKYAAENYGCQVVGVNISEEQLKYAREFCKNLPIEFVQCDYRDIDLGVFDKIIGAGIWEHVGYKNYRRFMEVVHRSLKDNGIFLLEVSGTNWSDVTNNLWYKKYIFPNSMAASIKYIGKAIEFLFVMEDWHNLGPDYGKTVLCWYRNFIKNWHKLKHKYDETFKRMLKFYFLSAAGALKARHVHSWQIVMSKNPIGQYSVRF